MDFFSVQNILVHIPIGAGGYDLSWIEAVGTIAGLLCIGLASLEKISNYFFGLINVTLFGIIFFQIQLYASLLLQVFFLCREYLRLVCVVATNQSERGGVENSLVAIAEGAKLVSGLRCFDWSDDSIYQSGVCIFDPRGSHDHASIRITGCDA